MDRSTEATLSTYDTWTQPSRLQEIYHFHRQKFRLTTRAFDSKCGLIATWLTLILVMWQWQWWTTLLSQHGFRLRGVQP